MTLLLTSTLKNKIAHIELNRPEKANALNGDFWKALRDTFIELDKNKEARVIVLSGAGKHFCAGIDLEFFAQVKTLFDSSDEARNRESLRSFILDLQETFNVFEKCRKPVLAAIHGSCIGAGIDMVTACDMRYATADANFSIKEVDMAMAADVGTLQRLPHLIGDGMMRELSYTGRRFSGEEAFKLGLVNQAFKTKEEMMTHVMNIAGEIAKKSPIAIRGIKKMIIHARDHSVDEGLDYVATWNSSALLSNDVVEALMSQMEKREAVFED